MKEPEDDLLGEGPVRSAAVCAASPGAARDSGADTHWASAPPTPVGRDLRAPLASIRTRIDQVLQTALTPTQRQDLEVVRASASALRRLIDEQFPLSAVETNSPAPARASCVTSCRPLRILVVEDNIINRLIIQRMLGDRQHSVSVAVNGREALDVYDHAPFDLVLMDLHMPEMDGLEATARLRERQTASGRWVPIVALTACATEDDRRRCLAAGMSDFLTKPIQIPELLRVLTTWTSTPGE